MTYDHALKPEYQRLMTAVQHTSGKRVNRFSHINTSAGDLLDKRFGMLPFGNAEVAGAGTHLYAAIGYALWSSDDSGATWRRTPRPRSGC